MQLRSDAATADMYAMKKEGATIAQIASRWNMNPAAIYQRLNRAYGSGMPRSGRSPVAANDNHPDRTTKMAPYNGGCSTTSGMMPVTLQRVPTLETAEVSLSAREMAAREMAVAA